MDKIKAEKPPRKHRFNLVIPYEYHKLMDDLRYEQTLTMQEIYNEAVKRYLLKYKKL
jgi:hypothetical protein